MRSRVGKAIGRHDRVVWDGTGSPTFDDESPEPPLRLNEAGSLAVEAALTLRSAPKGVDAELCDVESQLQLERVLDQLKPRERAVIIGRYGLFGGTPRTLDDIGRDIRRTRERTRQIQRIAENRLRTLLAPIARER
jgi:DNA-directed RNA polymerase specialized sigma subunit